MNITADDPRLTAYVLDELDPDGNKFIENEMARCNEWRFEARDLADFTDQLRATLAKEPMPDLAPTQQRAIEIRLKQTGSRRKPFWIPIGENWFLKTGLAILTILALWFVPVPAKLSSPVTGLFADASLYGARVILQAVGTHADWRGSTLVLPGPALPWIPRGYSTPRAVGRRMINFDNFTGNPLFWTTILIVTSLLIGNLYLRSTRRKFALTAVVIPVVILSDALRKFVVAEWLVHNMNGRMDISPLLDLALPGFVVFSLLALIPFLIWLRRSELKRDRFPVVKSVGL